MQFANRSQFNFDGLPSVFNSAETGNGKYITPVELREALGDLARLVYTRADFKGAIKLPSTDTGTFVVKLSDGVNVYASATVQITGASDGYFKVAGIDLSNVKGDSALRVVVDVTAATTATSAQCYASLDVEHPIVIGA